MQNKTIKVYSMDTLENDVPTMQPQTVHCMAFDQFNQASVKSKVCVSPTPTPMVDWLVVPRHSVCVRRLHGS